MAISKMSHPVKRLKINNNIKRKCRTDTLAYVIRKLFKELLKWLPDDCTSDLKLLTRVKEHILEEQNETVFFLFRNKHNATQTKVLNTLPNYCLSKFLHHVLSSLISFKIIRH